MNTLDSIDCDVLGKLLSLAKSLDDAIEEELGSQAVASQVVERVLIRRTKNSGLRFQVKSSPLWRFFTVTLSGRGKEYDLGHNFSALQALFSELSGKSETAIRHSAKGMAMYEDTVIDTKDAVQTLFSLEKTLNLLIDHIQEKKLSRQKDEEKRQAIVDALNKMRISFTPKK